MDTFIPPSATGFGRLRWAVLAVGCWMVSAAVVLAAALPVIHQHDDSIRVQVLDDLRQSIHHNAFTAERRLFERAANLRVLTRVPALHSYLSRSDESSRVQVEQVLSSVMNAYRVYDQARLIDLEGQELIRVNWHDQRAAPVGQSQLQNKADRYYVQQGLSLELGELLVTRADLNVEQGVIEQPHKAVVRLVAPVADAAGRKAGLLVFNVLASYFWQTPAKHPSFHSVDARPLWADSRGYWMAHHDPAQLWGADLDQPQHSISAVWPQAWEVVRRQTEGELAVPDGWLLFDTARPLRAEAGSATAPMPDWRRVVLNDPEWKVMLHIPEQELQQATLLGQMWFRALGIGLLVGLALPAFLFAALWEQRRLARLREHQQSAELKDLYDHAPCGYHSLDESGRILRVNRTELEWLGYEADEMVGRDVRAFMSPESQAKVAQAFPQFKAAGQIRELELDFLHRDGSTVPVSVAASVVRGADGRFLYSRSTLFDLRERRANERQLEHLAYFDVLTGLANRRHFMDSASAELSRSIRHGEPLALIAIDVDHFKRVNDRYGHATGDEVLKTLGSLMSAEGRPCDLVGRLGGEEFALLLPHTACDGARIVAEKLRDLVERTRVQVVPSSAQAAIEVTISLGVSCWAKGGDEHASLAQLLQMADAALYRAKADGRNRVVFA